MLDALIWWSQTLLTYAGVWNKYLSNHFSSWLDLNFIKSKVKVHRYYREYHFKGREYLELEVFQRRDITSTKVVVIPMIT